MTTIAFKDGKVVMRDGKVGTEQGCCCGTIACPDYYYVNFPANNTCTKTAEFTLLCDGFSDDDARSGADIYADGTCSVEAIGFLGPIDFGVYQQFNSARIYCSGGVWTVAASQGWACDQENYCVKTYTATVASDANGLPVAGAVSLTLVGEECSGENWCGNDYHEISVEITRP